MIKVDRIYLVVDMAVALFHKHLKQIKISPKGVSGKSDLFLIELPIKLPIEVATRVVTPAWLWLGGPRVLGRTGLALAWGAKGPGPGRLGFCLGGQGSWAGPVWFWLGGAGWWVGPRESYLLARQSKQYAIQ